MIKERQAAKDKQAKLSVMVVSDYREWEEKSWEEFLRALRALVNQEGIPVEKFMPAESLRFQGRIPVPCQERSPQ